MVGKVFLYSNIKKKKTKALCAFKIKSQTDAK